MNNSNYYCNNKNNNIIKGKTKNYHKVILWIKGKLNEKVSQLISFKIL